MHPHFTPSLFAYSPVLHRNFYNFYTNISLSKISSAARKCVLLYTRIKNTRYLSLSMETKHTPNNGTCTHETSWRHNLTTYASNLPWRHNINLFTSLSLIIFSWRHTPTNARSWRHTFPCSLRTPDVHSTHALSPSPLTYSHLCHSWRHKNLCILGKGTISFCGITCSKNIIHWGLVHTYRHRNNFKFGPL